MRIIFQVPGGRLGQVSNIQSIKDASKNIQKNVDDRYKGVIQESDQNQKNTQSRNPAQNNPTKQSPSPGGSSQSGASEVRELLKAPEAAPSQSVAQELLASPVTQATLGVMLAIGIIGCSIPVFRLFRKGIDASASQRQTLSDRLDQRIQSYLQKDFNKGFILQRPLWGKRTTFQKLLESFYKPKVPDGMVFIHNREVERLSPLAEQASAIDSEKFTSKEFIQFLKIRGLLYQDSGAYQGLENSLRLLTTAIEAKVCFETIWQVEFRYLSSKQQECYRCVDRLLIDEIRGQEFQDILQAKVDEVLPDINSEEGKRAINSYLDAMIRLSRQDFGLELLALFKQYEMSDYVVLVKADKILTQVEKGDLTDYRVALIPVTENYDALEKLAPIISLPKEKTDPDVLARIFHFAALVTKHQKSYLQFQQLVAVLLQWQDPYKSVCKIRQDYNVEAYRQPKEFTQKIPGELTYEKYNKWIHPK
ncbi:MAG: hypothetical protein MH252_12945 [Thermosynechococcaceae cyanobacterium MS004]|nr:hypothetical protein [Thermosynechococcaceae cyanobacterium MS004]